jgi:hypothetical protein
LRKDKNLGNEDYFTLFLSNLLEMHEIGRSILHMASYAEQPNGRSAEQVSGLMTAFSAPPKLSSAEKATGTRSSVYRVFFTHPITLSYAVALEEKLLPCFYPI